MLSSVQKTPSLAEMVEIKFAAVAREDAEFKADEILNGRIGNTKVIDIRMTKEEKTEQRQAKSFEERKQARILKEGQNNKMMEKFLLLTGSVVALAVIHEIFAGAEAVQKIAEVVSPVLG